MYEELRPRTMGAFPQTNFIFIQIKNYGDKIGFITAKVSFEVDPHNWRTRRPFEFNVLVILIGIA